MSKLVILGRDSVINHHLGHAIVSPDDWVPVPGNLEAIARLSQAGYRVAIVSTQPDLVQGGDLDLLNAIHHKLHDLLDRLGGHVVAISFCPHNQDENCSCRTSDSGLYPQLAERFGISMDNVTVIGHQQTDMLAALALGARPMLIATGASDLSALESNEHQIRCFDDLAYAANALLAED